MSLKQTSFITNTANGYTPTEFSVPKTKCKVLENIKVIPVGLAINNYRHASLSFA